MSRKITVTINQVTHIILESDVPFPGYQRRGVPAHYEKGLGYDDKFLWGGDNPLMCELFHTCSKLGAVLSMDFYNCIAEVTIDDESHADAVLQIMKSCIYEVWADALVEV